MCGHRATSACESLSVLSFAHARPATAVLRDVPPNKGAPRTPLGRTGEPILPRSLRDAWDTEQLPEPVLARAGATTPIRYGQLSARVHDRVKHVDVLVEHAVRTIQSRQPSIASLVVFENVDPATRILGLDLSVRTRNALLAAGLLIEGANLRHLTWGQLLGVTNLGVRSALEFTIAVERASRKRGRGAAPGALIESSTKRALERAERTSWANGLTLKDVRLGALGLPRPQNGCRGDRIRADGRPLRGIWRKLIGSYLSSMPFRSSVSGWKLSA